MRFLVISVLAIALINPVYASPVPAKSNEYKASGSSIFDNLPGYSLSKSYNRVKSRANDNKPVSGSSLVDYLIGKK
jgi:hypothetical protein